MSHQFPLFEVFLNKRGRGWTWRVCTTAGDVVMQGSDASRPAAQYQGYRALFLLLQSAAYQSIRLSNPDAGYSRSGPRIPPRGKDYGGVSRLYLRGRDVGASAKSLDEER